MRCKSSIFIYANNCPTRCNYIQLIYICKPFYMFRVVPVLSWTWLEGSWVPVQSRSRQVAVTVLLLPNAVDTVTWAPDDGWRYHPKHVEQFADINKLHIVASCWIVIDTNKTVFRDVCSKTKKWKLLSKKCVQNVKKSFNIYVDNKTADETVARSSHVEAMQWTRDHMLLQVQRGGEGVALTHWQRRR